MSQQDPNINVTSMLAGVVGQVGCITVILVLAALGAGIFLDNLLNTKPVFTILFVVGSVPPTLYLIVRISLTATARAQRATSLPKPEEENDAE